MTRRVRQCSHSESLCRAARGAPRGEGRGRLAAWRPDSGPDYLNQTCKGNFYERGAFPRKAKSMHRQNPQRRIESVGEWVGHTPPRRSSSEAAELKRGKNNTLGGAAERGGEAQQEGGVGAMKGHHTLAGASGYRLTGPPARQEGREKKNISAFLSHTWAALCVFVCAAVCFCTLHTQSGPRRHGTL